MVVFVIGLDWCIEFNINIFCINFYNLIEIDEGGRWEGEGRFCWIFLIILLRRIDFLWLNDLMIMWCILFNLFDVVIILFLVLVFVWWFLLDWIEYVCCKLRVVVCCLW